MIRNTYVAVQVLKNPIQGFFYHYEEVELLQKIVKKGKTEEWKRKYAQCFPGTSKVSTHCLQLLNAFIQHGRFQKIKHFCMVFEIMGSNADDLQRAY